MKKIYIEDGLIGKGYKYTWSHVYNVSCVCRHNIRDGLCRAEGEIDGERRNIWRRVFHTLPSPYGVC